MTIHRIVQNRSYLDRSAKFSKNFGILDAAANALVEYMTFEEVDKFLELTDKLAGSKQEGNWTATDVKTFFTEFLGEERYHMIQNMWVIENQNLVAEYNKADELKEICIHKISMREATPEEFKANPDNYTFLKVPK